MGSAYFIARQIDSRFKVQYSKFKDSKILPVWSLHEYEYRIPSVSGHDARS
jgi:hypothetical protein